MNNKYIIQFFRGPKEAEETCFYGEFESKETAMLFLEAYCRVENIEGIQFAVHPISDPCAFIIAKSGIFTALAEKPKEDE